jgi:uncharacterized DUF497 family protein
MAADVWELLARCTGFEWDDGNEPKVRERHRVAPGECEQAFFGELFLVNPDVSHSPDERRWQALGRTTARDMNRKERHRYGAAEARLEEDPEL